LSDLVNNCIIIRKLLPLLVTLQNLITPLLWIVRIKSKFAFFLIQYETFNSSNALYYQFISNPKLSNCD